MQAKEESHIEDDVQSEEKQDVSSGDEDAGADLFARIKDQARSLVMWEDITKSGAVFGAGLIGLFFIQILGYSVLTLVSGALLLQITLYFAYVNGVKLYYQYFKGGEQPPAINLGSGEPLISKEQVDSLVGLSVGLINKTSGLVQNVLSCKDNALTLKVVGGLVVLAILGNLFSGMTLFTLAFLGAFSIPQIYTRYQIQIDAALATALGKASLGLQQLSQRLPFLAKHLPAPSTASRPAAGQEAAGAAGRRGKSKKGL